VAAALGSGCLLLLTLWAALTEVEVVVSAPAAARPAGGTSTLRASGPRRVVEVLVEEGDVVAAGQLIVLLEDAAARSRRHSVSVALAAQRHRLATLQEVARTLDGGLALGDDVADEVRLRVVEQRSRRARFDGEREAMAAELKALKARGSAARQLLLIRDERHRAAEIAFQRGALSRFELLRSWQDALAQRAEVEGADDQAGILRARMSAHRSAAQESSSHDRQVLDDAIVALGIEVADLEAAQAEAQERSLEGRIAAPVAGVVEQLRSSPGELVDRGEVVAVIVPAGRPLMFETRVAPSQAAFLRRGQNCRIKLDALPFARYGALPCTVESLSADVVAAERGVGHYLVRVRPAAERLEADGRPVRLQPGATAWVDIVAGRRTVLSFVTEPLRRFAAESLREQ
jgi:HlyD family type I secretion membrane fusion protein